MNEVNDEIENEVVYELKAYVDGEEVFKGEYPDTIAVEEEGLRKAEHAIGEALDLLGAENE